MVSFYSVDNFRVFLIFLADIDTNLNVRTFDFGSKSLTYIVEKTRTSCKVCINAEFGSKYSRKWLRTFCL